MKFIYTIATKKYFVLPTLSDALALAQEGKQLSPEEKEGKWVDVPVGGYFMPEDNQSQINLTSEFLIRENRDMVNANLSYLKSFIPQDTLETSYMMQNPDQISESAPDPNYIGKWNSKIDSSANIYYVIYESEIRKMIFSKPIDSTKQTDIFGVIYIIEDNGRMMYCTPDEGDILFDNLKEARNFIKTKNEIFKPLTKH